MESFAREYLGSVELESGVIRISDPAESRDIYISELKGAKSLEGVVQGKRDLLVGAFFDTGRYSVFGRRNEQGELTSIEILLDETEPEEP